MNTYPAGYGDWRDDMERRRRQFLGGSAIVPDSEVVEIAAPAGPAFDQKMIVPDGEVVEIEGAPMGVGSGQIVPDSEVVDLLPSTPTETFNGPFQDTIGALPNPLGVLGPVLSPLFRGVETLAAGEVDPGRSEYDIMREAMADDPEKLAEFEQMMGPHVQRQEAIQERAGEEGMAEAGPRSIVGGLAGGLGATAQGIGHINELLGREEAARHWRDRAARVRARSQEIMPPEHQQSFGTDTAAGLGSMLQYLVPGMAAAHVARGLGPAVQAGASLLTAGSMAAPAGMAEAYDRAIQAGLSEEEALQKSIPGAAAGAVQVAPVAVILRKIPPHLRGRALEQARRVIEAAGAEFLAEGTGAVMQNLIEQSYNPDKGTWDDTLYQAAVGGSAGALTQLGVSALTRGRGGPIGVSTPRTPDADPEAGPGPVAPTEQITEQVPDSEVEIETQPQTIEGADDPVSVPAEPAGPVAEPTQQLAPAAGPDAARAAPTAPQRERVVTPDGEFETEVEFQVVEADQLRAAEGQLQPRDRAGRVGSDLQIGQMAANLDPLRLIGSRESDRGAPIIDETNTILSGNGRAAAIMAAMESNPDRYEQYRATLAQMGYDIEGMRAPVLVRRASVPEDAKRRFATRSNTDGGLTMSPAERAGMEQDYISPDMLAGFNTDVEGGVSAAGNAQFVRDFMRNMPANERSGLTNRDGSLTPGGAQRVAGAIFSRAYGDKSMVERFVEDEKDPAIRNALTGAAPAWARMRDRADSSFDVTKDLVEAISLINRARQAGMKLAEITAQMDAFGDVSPRAKNLARLFFNRTGNKLAAWRDIRDRLRSYAESAERTANAAGDLLGGEQADADQIIEQLVNNVSGEGESGPAAPAAAAAAPAGDELFSGSETLSRGPQRGRKAAAKSEPDEGDLFDGPLEDAGTETLRAPRGAMTPSMESASFSKRGSMFEEAFRAAGLDPDAAVNLPPRQQAAVLQRLLEQTFGMKVELSGNVRDNIDQMLDAFRNTRFMLHTLALPLQALGLNGTVTLALERYKGRYLGAYNPATQTVHLPGRSNSFAHEWAHALDHFLVRTLKPGAERRLFSMEARNGGLDPTQSLDAAFGNLINRMFFEDADLAAHMLRLESEAADAVKKGPNAGQPTKKAEEARKQLERMKTGGTRVKVQPSRYRADSADYSPSQAGYYASVHEMLARAFEAYIAHKVEVAGGSNEFITKGDRAYLSDADRRLAMTFPKADERLAIFAAFEEVLAHLRRASIFGTDPATSKPSDADIIDPQKWNKLTLEQGDPGRLADVKEEVRRIVNVFRPDPNRTYKERLIDGASIMALRAGLDPNKGGQAKTFAKGAARAARLMVGSYRGYIKTLLAGTGEAKPILETFVHRVMTDPGSGRDAGGFRQTYEETREQVAAKTGQELELILKHNLSRNVFHRTNATGQLPDAINKRIRDLLHDSRSVPNATAQEKAIAAALRRVFNRQYRRATAAGVDVGYIEDTGYLPRVLKAGAVLRDEAGFLKSAEQVYGIMFDQLTQNIDGADLITLAQSTASRMGQQGQLYGSEIKAVRDAMKAVKKASEGNDAKALKSAQSDLSRTINDLKAVLKPDYSEQSSQDWLLRIRSGDSFTYDSHGPDSKFKQPRKLPKEADQLLEQFYETNVLSQTMTYAYKSEAKAAYQERFGQPGGEKRLEAVLNRQSVRDAIARNPRKYDKTTARGVTNIIRDLANPRTDNLIEIAMREAAKFGAPPDAISGARGMIENITGRVNRAPHSSTLEKFTMVVFAVATLTLLGRVTLASLVENLTIQARFGDRRATLASTAALMSEIRRSNPTVQERAAVARAIGLIVSPLSDAALMNRLDLNLDDNFRGSTLMSNFFRGVGLTQLTNAQYRATMVGAHVALHHLAVEHGEMSALAQKGDKKARARQRIIEAEFTDLGVTEGNMEAFLKFMAESDAIPDVDTTQTELGEQWGSVILRARSEIIANPRRADKPAYASHPIGRLAFFLTSFLYTFFRNTVLSNFERAGRNYTIGREEGLSRGEAAAETLQPLGAGLAAGAITLYTAHFLVTLAREWLLNGEAWERHEEDGSLWSWLTGLALSRTGLFGASDVVFNALSGLRYQRDLTSLPVGIAGAAILGNIQDIVRGLPTTELWPFGEMTGQGNSPNTNTAERKAVAAGYRLLANPAIAAGLSALPGAGPIASAARVVGIGALTSPGAASTAADVLVGEPDR